uniref:RdRp n=1 Tax=Beihai partiti-like virus 4 TaxID=1922506 RepID=A0A1L3KLX9_9VIRU|nr:RdRp [Beihai partiti-like virus 4]
MDDRPARVFTKKKDVELSSVEECAKRLKYRRELPPCTIAFRSHISRTTHKVRPIFVYPTQIVVNELRFTTPLTSAVKSRPSPLMTGFNWFRGDHRAMISDIGGRRAISLDVSAFDMSFHDWQIRDAFDILATRLVLNEEDYMVFSSLVSYFIHTPVQSEDGVQRLPGIPSGSGFTHLIGCVLNAILLNYLDPDLAWYCVYGDDSVIVSTKPLSYYFTEAEKVGMQLSKDKSRVGIDWLGFNLDSGKPKIINPTKRMASLLLPEVRDTSPAHFYGRVLGHLVASLGDERVSYNLLTWLQDNYQYHSTRRIPRDMLFVYETLDVAQDSPRQLFQRILTQVL